MGCSKVHICLPTCVTVVGRDRYGGNSDLETRALEQPSV